MGHAGITREVGRGDRTAGWASRRGRDGGRLVNTTVFRVFVALVLVQGIHVVEHVIQLVQIYLFGVPEDDALGLLGYVFEIQGTEEWLHLGFNAVYLLALYFLLVPLARAVRRGLPLWAFLVFLVGGVGLETWHEVEHIVITSNIVRNGGCPCPGILDVRLGVGDSVLHFFYNTITYVAALVPFPFVWRSSRSGSDLVSPAVYP